MSNWLSGLDGSVMIKITQPKVEMPAGERKPKKARLVVAALETGEKTTAELAEITGLTEKEIWNAIKGLNDQGVIEKEPVRYRLKHSYL